MSILNLPPEMICHILGFLGIKDHSRFSLACKEYYEAFGITKIECDKGAEVRYDDFANRYTVLQGHHHRCRVLKRVVGLDVVKIHRNNKACKGIDHHGIP